MLVTALSPHIGYDKRRPSLLPPTTPGSPCGGGAGAGREVTGESLIVRVRAEAMTGPTPGAGLGGGGHCSASFARPMSISSSAAWLKLRRRVPRAVSLA